ncbi:uncharacterized protein CFAP97D2 [Alosa alosa]|uniref:uncharacterized protein CFAP97D2 n=1 Tax=Alosa alosa TaxID=278164 RepID=UPI0020152B7F|nr:uncharacterized protein CFAP97D2 [Alosa alosa]
MHKAYQPLKPSTNKYLQKKWDQTYYEEHRSKVTLLSKNAKSVVDTKGIETPLHVQLKLKKLQLQEEKLAIIERDNRLLSSRLADIMRSRGLVDHRNYYSEHSLNAERRQKEFLQVSCENQAILQRIRACESDYCQQRWQEDWKNVEHQRDDIARYPRKLAKKKNT